MKRRTFLAALLTPAVAVANDYIVTRGYSVEAEPVYSGIEPVPAVEETPALLLLTTTGCAPCEQAKAALKDPSVIHPDWLSSGKLKVVIDHRIAEMAGVDAYPAFALMQGNRVVGAVKRIEQDSIQRFVQRGVEAYLSAFTARATTDDAGSAPTPLAEVVRVLALLPTPQVGFVDYGCGDARWCIAAAERWKCRVTGVEIDPERAEIARQRVKESRLSQYITIITGDATTTEVQADVGVAYLYPETMAKMKSQIAKLSAFASYIHQPEGIAATQNGDSWIYIKPRAVQQAYRPVYQQPRQRTAVWGGQVYTGPVCSNPRCSMCASIRAQLGQ